MCRRRKGPPYVRARLRNTNQRTRRSGKQVGGARAGAGEAARADWGRSAGVATTLPQ